MHITYDENGEKHGKISDYRVFLGFFWEKWDKYRMDFWENRNCKREDFKRVQESVGSRWIFASVCIVWDKTGGGFNYYKVALRIKNFCQDILKRKRKGFFGYAGR